MEWKRALQGLFRTLGLEVHKVAKGGSYTLHPPYGYATYSPWFEEPFRARYERIRSRTLVSEDRCYVIHQLARWARHLDGDFAECGVYKGGTALLIAETLAEAGIEKRFDLFDTFTGMPDPGGPSHHAQGDFGDVSLEEVKSVLRGHPGVAFHPGFIPDTFAGLEDASFAFSYVDVDIYPSVRDCCTFLYPRTTHGGILLFDDYGLPAYQAEARRAVDEFFSDKPESPVVLGSGQCFVLKI